jgi:hypothetical protein
MGRAMLPPGEYTLHVGSDDGARVWMDDTFVLDAWDPHGQRTDTVAIPGGSHTFRVKYYEIAGFSELTFNIQKRRSH